MSYPIISRAAALDDVPAILAIYNDAVLKTTASYDIEPQSLDKRRRWFANHERSGLPVFVATSEGVVVGWGALNRFRSKAGYRLTVEDSVYIAEDQRGRGIGKHVLGLLIDAARGVGLQAIVAVIDAWSVAC